MNRISNPFAMYLNTAKELPPREMQQHYTKAITDGDIEIANAISRIVAMQSPFCTMSTSM